MPTNEVNTIRLHRVLRATPERIYRAFLDADALAKWLPPNGFTGKVHRLDAEVGGVYQMSFTNFTSKGLMHANPVLRVVFNNSASPVPDLRTSIMSLRCPDSRLGTIDAAGETTWASVVDVKICHFAIRKKLLN